MSTATKLFDNVCRRFKSLGITFSALRYQVSYGSRDSTTGWRVLSTGSSSITMPIAARGSTHVMMPSGTYAIQDAVGLTRDTVVIGDFIFYQGVFYTVWDIVQRKVGDQLAYYECQLLRQPMFAALFDSPTWSKTRPSDPRELTKDYLDSKIRDAQITKDNDSTEADWEAIWANPPYPISQEFRAGSNPVQGLYVIDRANSTPLIDCDQTPHGYREHIPIHIMTVDSTACGGTSLNWKMEAELRYVCETYPEGSQRKLEFVAGHDRMLSGMWFYDREFRMDYRRPIT